MLPGQLIRIVITALACGFMALVGECFVRIVRGCRMDDHMALSALCFAAAVLLFMLFVFADRVDPKPPPAVRIDDRRTWRHEHGFFEDNWPNIVGPLVIGAGLCIFFAA